IWDWLRVLEVPVPDLCYTAISGLVVDTARRVVVAKNQDRHLEYSEPVPVFRHVGDVTVTQMSPIVEELSRRQDGGFHCEEVGRRIDDRSDFRAAGGAVQQRLEVSRNGVRAILGREHEAVGHAGQAELLYVVVPERQLAGAARAAEDIDIQRLDEICVDVAE